MSNIFYNNFHNLKLRLNTDEYWDLSLDRGGYDSYGFNSNVLYDKCLIAYIDTSIDGCVQGNRLNGVEDYVWEDSISIGYPLKNIGYTGFDNGIISFKKDRIMNKDFVELYQNSRYEIEPLKNLILHKVSGSTMLYEYPLEIQDGIAKLNGGFYQGFFKTECEKYQVLPTVLGDGEIWVYEFILKREDFEKESNKTLNDKYEDNKGIFFYLGTRSENKWMYLYDTEDDECFTLSYDDYIEDGHIDINEYKINNFLDMSIDMPIDEDSEPIIDNVFEIEEESFDLVDWQEEPKIEVDIICDDRPEMVDYIEDDIDISNNEYTTDGDLIIGSYEEYWDTDNKFLLFNRTEDGYNVHNWHEGDHIRYVQKRNTFNGNLFLLMNRTSTGYTVYDIETLKSQYNERYNVYKDLYNNALAFRITDDGKIGYRYLVQDCEKDYTIKEGYSKEGIVPYNEWSSIVVKMQGQKDTMVLRFYVNGNLVFITDPMPKINLRPLDEIYEKQETVPFNISIGGGTQGLCDTILPNYMLEPYRKYPLEEHFAGTFIGYFKTFKFYTCDVEHGVINHNFQQEITDLT